MNYERPKIVIAVIVSVFTIGVVECDEPKPLSLEEIQEIKNLVNQSGKITNNQAERLSKVETLHISEDHQPLIDKYKNQ
tara:strand:+ start:3011 stop:3247 length:237 start_codon:yes stop_codon:yes gene_type:complete